MRWRCRHQDDLLLTLSMSESRLTQTILDPVLPYHTFPDPLNAPSPPPPALDDTRSLDRRPQAGRVLLAHGIAHAPPRLRLPENLSYQRVFHAMLGHTDNTLHHPQGKAHRWHWALHEFCMGCRGGRTGLRLIIGGCVRGGVLRASAADFGQQPFSLFLSLCARVWTPDT